MIFKLEELKKIANNFDSYILQIVKYNEVRVLDSNRAQLFDGKLSSGNRIEPPYAKSTIKRKKRKGQPTNRVTVKDEGDLYAEMYITYSGDSFEINSKADHTQYVLKRYGPEIFGLTEESLTEIRGIIIKDIEQKFKDAA